MTRPLDDGTSPAAIAERYYVGALLQLRGDAQRDAAAALDADTIGDVQLAQIHRVIAQQHRDTERTVTAADVVPAMIRAGMPEQLHGVATALVIDLLAGCPVPEWWPDYAATIRAEHVRRRVRQHAGRLADVADTASGTRLAAALDDVGALATAAAEQIGDNR